MPQTSHDWEWWQVYTTEKNIDADWGMVNMTFFTHSDAYRASYWLITCGIPDISTRLATNSVNPCKRRKAVLETKYFVLFSANSLGDIYNVVPPAISWFINHSKYRYIYHKP